MKVTRSRFTKDTKHCHKLIYLLESYCPLSYTFPAHLILFILKKSFTIASGHDMSDVCNPRAILHIHDVLSELFYQYYGMCKENTVFQPYRIEMLKNHSGLQSGHAS